MFARFIGQLKAKTAQQNGFTLIEVIIAIAVLSLVSIALLEMFTVSAKTNMQAGEMDKAKSLCVEASEKFKDNPAFDPAEPGENGYLSSFDYMPGGTDEIIFTKHLDRQWREAADEDHAAYELEIVSKKEGETEMPASYYPPAVWGGETITVLYTPVSINLERLEGQDPPVDAGYIRLTVNGTPYSVDQGKIIYYDADVADARTSLIPILLDCSRITGYTEIQVENNVVQLTRGGKTYEAIADIYLCDAPDEEGKEVVIKANKGAATENRISTAVQKITRYSAVIRVRDKDSGRVIVESSVEKYWADN